MRSIGRVALVTLVAACAAPRIAEPYGVAGARFSRPLGACLAQALRSANVARYKGEVAPGSPNTVQAQHFWLYGHYNDPGPRIVGGIATERICSDGTRYLFVNVHLAGSVADAEPARILPMLDQLVAHVARTCALEPIETDRAHMERSPKGKCVG